MKLKRFLIFLTGLWVLAACRSTGPTALPTISPSVPAPTDTPSALPSPTEAPAEEPIYLSILWHQHQPLYFKDSETGLYVRPWVRLHAAKDYVDMAAILEEYPEIRATFNLTPSLIRQLDDLGSGAKDVYQSLAETAAEDLTDEEKDFILARFFDTNRKIIARFPRYQELLELREAAADPRSAYSVQDFRDLQVLFNLAWVDPDWLAEEPLASLVEKGRNFAESDKEVLFAEHLRLVREVIPTYRRLQEAGQIEVTMTPYAHPILPLLVTTDLAREALPDLELPAARFVYGQDAAAQVELGAQLYAEHFGRPPRGMWPAEGSVAQEIITLVAKRGIRWMASDEGVLAKSLGLESFTRDAGEVVGEADRLYRPYYVQGAEGGPVAIVFRDTLLSDKVGFTYSGQSGESAAADFIQRIHAIREKLRTEGAPGPHLVSVILDGENAWEHYDNDGKAFLHALYQGLSADPTIVTITPGEFLARAPEQPAIEDLWAGSWINHDFSTWIGEEEENTAWEYLAAARQRLQEYLTGRRRGQASPEQLEEATLLMYTAEGSDWFWWYGADQNSGNDEVFDQQFRDTLKQVYLALGEAPPPLLDVPILPQPAAPADRPATDRLTPAVDGRLEEAEWAAAGLYYASGGVMAAAERAFESLAFGFDSQNLYLGVDLADDFALPAGESYLDVYLHVPGGGSASHFTRAGTLLGFPANRRLALRFAGARLQEAALFTAGEGGVWEPAADPVQAALGDRQLELRIPLAALGGADSGDRLTLRAFFGLAAEAALQDADQVPGPGPADLIVPDLGTTTLVLEVVDPEGDDHGPGRYTYPLDAVFTPGNFDVLNFQVGHDADEIVFKFALRGPVDNPWGSPNGLSLQTLDIYIDTDGDGQGGVALLPGRNLALAEGYAWDYAITAEGWAPGIYAPGEEGPRQVASASEFTILVDPAQREVTLRVPKAILGDDPEAWKIGAVALSQEGFPAAGVMRVRDVLPVAEQWRIGGAPSGATNHTRVLDLVWPAAGQQERWLSDFTPVNAPQAELTPEDFARVPLLDPGALP